MKLATVQTEFCAYLLDRPNILGPEVEGDMAVYHYAYRAQLLGCLQDTFEKTWSWLGDERFETAAQNHIATHPPQSWTLNLYGRAFDRTLAALYPDDPEIAELAWLEWTLRRAFDGRDADPIDPATLAGIDWDAAMLFFVPTLKSGPISSNCAAIWTALAEGRTPPAAERLSGKSAIRVWRQGLSARFRSIDAFEERALRLALSGTSFAEICAIMAVEREDAPQEIGRILSLWLQDGMIAAISDHGEDRLPMSLASPG